MNAFPRNFRILFSHSPSPVRVKLFGSLLWIPVILLLQGCLATVPSASKLFVDAETRNSDSEQLDLSEITQWKRIKAQIASDRVAVQKMFSLDPRKESRTKAIETKDQYLLAEAPKRFSEFEKLGEGDFFSEYPAIFTPQQSGKIVLDYAQLLASSPQATPEQIYSLFSKYSPYIPNFTLTEVGQFRQIAREVARKERSELYSQAFFLALTRIASALNKPPLLFVHFAVLVDGSLEDSSKNRMLSRARSFLDAHGAPVGNLIVTNGDHNPRTSAAIQLNPELIYLTGSQAKATQIQAIFSQSTSAALVERAHSTRRAGSNNDSSSSAAITTPVTVPYPRAEIIYDFKFESEITLYLVEPAVRKFKKFSVSSVDTKSFTFAENQHKNDVRPLLRSTEIRGALKTELASFSTQFRGNASARALIDNLIGAPVNSSASGLFPPAGARSM